METRYAPLVLRIFFGIGFLVAGLDKVLSFSMAKGMFGGLFGSAGTLMLVLAIVIELVGGLALVLGYKTRYVAGGLAAFIVVAFVSTFQIGPAANVIGSLRELMVMNTGGGNTAVNFAYFGALLSLVFSGGGVKSMKD
ncbi:MAG: DoxX family protein [Candidatus Nanoarchaeia archaeon]